MQANDENVAYIKDSNSHISFIPTSKVERIIFNDKTPDKVFSNADKKIAKTKKQDFTYTNKFIDSYLRLSLILGMTSVNGDITDKEQKIFNDNESIFESDDESYHMDHYSFPRGLELNFLSPFLTYKTHKVGLTGFNIGLKTRYTFTTLDQVVGAEFNYYTGVLLKYYTLSAGPEFNIIFGNNSNSINFIIQLYSLAGYIPYGKVRAATCVREVYSNNEQSGIDSSQTNKNFNGFSFTGGIGFYWSFNKRLPLIIGFSLFYSHTKIEFEDAVFAYDRANSSSFNEKGILISIGTWLWKRN